MKLYICTTRALLDTHSGTHIQWDQTAETDAVEELQSSKLTPNGSHGYEVLATAN